MDQLEEINTSDNEHSIPSLKKKKKLAKKSSRLNKILTKSNKTPEPKEKTIENPNVTTSGFCQNNMAEPNLEPTKEQKIQGTPKITDSQIRNITGDKKITTRRRTRNSDKNKQDFNDKTDSSDKKKRSQRSLSRQKNDSSVSNTKKVAPTPLE